MSKPHAVIQCVDSADVMAAVAAGRCRFVPIAGQVGSDRNCSASLTLPVVGAIRPEKGQRTS